MVGPPKARTPHNHRLVGLGEVEHSGSTVSPGCERVGVRVDHATVRGEELRVDPEFVGNIRGENRRRDRSFARGEQELVFAGDVTVLRVRTRAPATSEVKHRET